jgi:hypothetical protein
MTREDEIEDLPGRLGIARERANQLDLPRVFSAQHGNVDYKRRKIAPTPYQSIIAALRAEIRIALAGMWWPARGSRNRRGAGGMMLPMCK